jgi:hypothetical protein
MTQPPRWGLRNEEQAFRNAYCDRRVHHDRGPRMTGNAPTRESPHAHRHSPGTERLGGFSDGVIAVIITIMVLELHVPRAPTAAALLALWPTFASYLLSTCSSQSSG